MQYTIHVVFVNGPRRSNVILSYFRPVGRSGVGNILTGTPDGRPPHTLTGTTGRGTRSGGVREGSSCQMN